MTEQEIALRCAEELAATANNGQDSAFETHAVIAELRNAVAPLGLLPVDREVADICKGVQVRICAIADALLKGLERT